MVVTLIGLVARPARDAVGILAFRCTLTAGFALRLITPRVETCAALT